MEERRKRIEAFIANHEDSKLESGAFIIGGQGQTPNSTMSTTNNQNCTNTSYATCDKSTNNGSCKNAQFACNNSKNGGSCNNAYKEIKNESSPSC